MAEIKIYKNVRFANRIDTEANWVMNNPTLEPGELAFVGEAGDYYMILGDTHKKPIKQIIQEQKSGAHDTHIFYPGKGSSSPGGSSSIPIASATLVGGVKVAESVTSGLILSTDGSLSNALIERYDFTRDCFVIKKLYVQNLEYDNKVTNPAFEGDTLTLRDGATIPVSVKAGIVITNLKRNFNGFLGLSAENRIMIAQEDGTNAQVLGIGYTGQDASGMVQITKDGNVAYLKPCTTLNIIDGTNSLVYDPSLESVAINITPPAIKVNGQSTSYNAETREYNITLDGGLTPENITRIEQLEQSLDDIATLKTETLTDIQAGDRITVTKIDRVVTVDHAGNTLKEEEIGAARYTVSNTSNPEILRFLTNIELDEYGHVTKKYFTDIEWVIN